MGEVVLACRGQQLAHVEGHAPELDREIVPDDGVLAPGLERHLRHRAPVLVDEADAAGTEPECPAEPSQPLQVDVAGGNHGCVDSFELPFDLLMRGRRQHHGLGGPGRGMTAEQRADRNGRLERAQESETVVSELLARPARRLEKPLTPILVLDRLRLRAELESQQEVVRVAEDARARELADQVDALGRLRPALCDVAERDDQVRLPSLEIGERRSERDRVAVHVGEQGDPHWAELTGMP